MDGTLGRVAALTGRGAGTVVRTLVRQGEVAAERAEHIVDELLGRSEAGRDALAGLVRGETERVVNGLGLARQADLDELRRRVGDLEARRPAPGSAPPGPAQPETTLGRPGR